MSGRPTHTDDSSRRRFLKQLAALLALGPAWDACKNGNSTDHITGSILGADHASGHLLRNPGAFPPPTAHLETGYFIAGGGVSGLSAARWLHLQGAEQVMMAELAARPGGNAAWGERNGHKYPWGAHYLPVPEPCNAELIDFLKEAGVVTGTNENGLPEYNEYHLCHDPEERLLISGRWQEGLVPTFGITREDKQQIDRFFDLVTSLKQGRGNDGRHLFCIPIDRSSADPATRKLDKLSFATYLAQNGFSSPALLWYLEYCCKDDYGADLNNTSAWAGLHYFASRRGAAQNAPSHAILTWPEGNGFLVQALQRQSNATQHSNSIVHKVEITDEGVLVYCYDTKQQKTTLVKAEKLLMATPQYVNKHIAGLPDRSYLAPHLAYAPWVIANISLKELPSGNGFPLCWDNVMYGTRSVGYVHAEHQSLSQGKGGIITWYLPLTGEQPASARRRVYHSIHKDWVRTIVNELTFAHEDIARNISNIDVWIWGHGMIRPSPGYIWSAARQDAMRPTGNRIYYAHSDLCGISNFEEAFYQGINAAKQMLRTS